MKITRSHLKQMIREAASEYVWGVKNPGRVANKYKISVLKQIILEELEVVLTNEEAGELFGEEIEEMLNEEDLEEDAPAGWERTVKKMKKNPKINNPWALAHYMAKQGAKPGGAWKRK